MSLHRPDDEQTTDAASARPAEGGAPAPADAAAVAAADVPAAGEPAQPRRRKHRRVRTEPVPGSDPNPAPETPRHTSGENDEQLKRDVPPHWG